VSGHIPGTLWASLVRAPRGGDARRRAQEKRLAALLRHAAAHSPFYRAALRGSRVTPAHAWRVLLSLPVLDKAALRARLSEIRMERKGAGREEVRRTSGSSGEPLYLPTLPAEFLFDSALWLAEYVRRGLRPWHRQVKFTHLDRAGKGGPAWSRAAFRRRRIASSALPEEKVRAIRAARPHALFGWASLLGEVALQLERENATLRVPLIFSSSDLLWDSLRRRVEERLQGRVVDMYGSEETGLIGVECPTDGGFHVRGDLVIVELLDDADRPASRGRVVCTVLWKRLVPLIRYALGDVAEWATGGCACGCSWPRLAKLHGRIQDLWRLPSGEWISAGTLESVLYGIAGIEMFQFVKQAPASLALELVASASYTAEAERRILENFRARFGDGLKLEVVRVPAIRKGPGEKFRPFVARDGSRDPFAPDHSATSSSTQSSRTNEQGHRSTR
jgi:phenylacetate-CoA ligase